MKTTSTMIVLAAALTLTACGGPPPGFPASPALTAEAVADLAVREPLPDPRTPAFCETVQKFLSSTSRGGQVTLFTDMPEYRHSKPMADPHTVFQVVTYEGQEPIVVSCKIKTAAHLRAAYGDDAAGTQYFCPDMTRRIRAQAVAELRAAGQSDAADKASAFVIDENVPYTTGQEYLSDFQSGYAGNDGVVHLNSPGLYQNYDSWITPLLPKIVQGQAYCHLPTVGYVKLLATGAMQPGRMVTTGENATVTPR